MTREIILDVDTGTDDAVAVMLAALHPDIELLACTTVWGNLPVENTTDNTLRVLEHIGAGSVEVHRGLDAPFAPVRVAPPIEADQSKGAMHPEHLDLAPTTLTAAQPDAVEFLVETLRQRTQPVTLVPTGPLTNIAAAVTIDPTIVDAVDEIVIMGGANEFGNVTPSAEANIWHDPIAADVVVSAGFRRLVLVPLDATHAAPITADQAKQLRETGTPAATAAARCIEQRITAHDESQPQPIAHSTPLHDPLCIAYLLDPAVVSLQHVHLGIETSGSLTVGRTVIDTRHRSFDAPNAHVALDADPDLFLSILLETLGRPTAG